MKRIKAEGEVQSFVSKMQKGLSKGKLTGVVSFHEEQEAMIVK